MNKEQQEFLNEVYENYEGKRQKWEIGRVGEIPKLSKEEFINKCKTDPEFSGKWGLKIEERNLSLEERLELWYQKNKSETGKRGIWEIDYIEKYEGHKKLNSYNIPTKVITITYNNETIESYEKRRF